MSSLICRWTVLLGAVLLCGGCANSIYKGANNVVEISCEGTWDTGSVCNGTLTASSRLEFLINPLTRSVFLTVDQSNSNWFIQSRIYKDCAIIDSDNWECGDSEKIGMRDGVYRRYSEGAFSYEIRGVSGWRYWAMRFGRPRLAFLGMTK